MIATFQVEVHYQGRDEDYTEVADELFRLLDGLMGGEHRISSVRLNVIGVRDKNWSWNDDQEEGS